LHTATAFQYARRGARQKRRRFLVERSRSPGLVSRQDTPAEKHYAKPPQPNVVHILLIRLMSVPSWELSKENVAPLVRGRDKAALNTAIHATRNEIADAHTSHEAAVAAALAGCGPHAADPLTPAAAFVKWAADAYQPGAAPLLAALERSCLAFVGDARYNNDPRFVRLWVRYADARDDPLDCFAHMRTHKIGEESALFYEAWATTLEYKKDFKAADAAYHLGLQRDAQPKNRLQQRQHEFLARMVAREHRAEAKAAKAQQQGVKSAVLSQGGGMRGVVTSDAGGSTGDENVRPALGALTARQAVTGRRPALAPTNGAKSGRSGRGPQTRVPLSSRMGGNANNVDTSFHVFRDPDIRGPNAATDIASGGRSLPTLTKLDEVRKENEGELPSKWAGTVLPQDESMARARARAAARQHQGESSNPFKILREATEHEVAAEGTNDSQREDLNRNTLDALAKRGKWTAAGPAGPASPTINTKIAMQEVEDMFNSTLPFEREDNDCRGDAEENETFPRSSENTPKRANPVAFKIFRDDPDLVHGKDDAGKPERVADCGDKENADGVRNLKPRSFGDMDTAAGVLRPLPELESAVDPNDPSSFVEVEYTPLPTDADQAHRVVDSAPGRQGTPEDVSAKLEDWCIDSCPDLPGYEMMEGNCEELNNGNIVCFEGGAGVSRSFFIESKLGEGREGKSVVYSASPLDDGDDAGEDDEEQIFAIKAADNVNLLWEFYIYNAVCSRLPDGADPRARTCVPKALFFYHGAPLSYLVTDRVSVATLAQAVDLATNVQSCEMTVAVATFFLLELLRALEFVHSAGVIHADVTLENVIIRKDNAVRWTGPYNAAGKNGWAGKGVALVDFNHAVDARHPAVGGWSAEHLLAHTSFLGNTHMGSESGVAANSVWGFDADCLAAAACGRQLVAACGNGKIPLVFERVFAKLTSVASEALSDETVDVMRQCRYALEESLIVACSRDDGAVVRASLKTLFVAASEASQAGDITRC
jgi:Mad3/BUB1 homology region 1